MGAVSRSHASHGAEKSSPPIGFDRGEVPRVAFVMFRDAYMRCPEDNWEQRVIDGLAAAAPYLAQGEKN